VWQTIISHISLIVAACGSVVEDVILHNQVLHMLQAQKHLINAIKNNFLHSSPVNFHHSIPAIGLSLSALDQSDKSSVQSSPDKLNGELPR
jgi:hypothetical protein